MIQDGRQSICIVNSVWIKSFKFIFNQTSPLLLKLLNRQQQPAFITFQVPSYIKTGVKFIMCKRGVAIPSTLSQVYKILSMFPHYYYKADEKHN